MPNQPWTPHLNNTIVPPVHLLPIKENSQNPMVNLFLLDRVAPTDPNTLRLIHLYLLMVMDLMNPTPNQPPSDLRYPLGGTLNHNRKPNRPLFNLDRHPSNPINLPLPVLQNYYGDRLTPKGNQIFRGLSCQLGGFPVDPQDPKHEEFIYSTTALQPDVIAIQEIGIIFTYAGIQGQWKNRLGWNHLLDPHCSKTVNAWNVHSNHRRIQQYGGTALLALGASTFYAAGAGKDQSGLGRWCWTRYRGSDNTHFRVILFYHPNDNAQSTELSVAAQHTRYLYSKKDDRQPRIAFLQDLHAELETFQNEGDLLVVCGDTNQDVLSAEVTQFFASLQLKHLIFSRHDSTAAPATMACNHSRVSVDGIWASLSITLIQGGYLDFDIIPGDHQPIWFDLSYTQVFGHDLPTIWKPQARRLQLRDPRCIQRYIKLLKEFLLHYNLPKAQFSLENSTSLGAYSDTSQKEAARIDHLTTEGQLYAENHCRKLRMGGVQFSEETLLPRKQLFFWKLALKRRTGRYVRSCQWSRAKSQAQITEPISDLSIAQIGKRIKLAMTCYKQAQKSHESSQLKFIESFDPKLRDRILRCEEQRCIGRLARLISKRIQTSSVTYVTRTRIVNGNKTDEECHSPEAITSALLEANASKYKQSINSPFLHQPLLSDFGLLGDTPATEQVLNGTYIAPLGTPPLVITLLQHMKRPEALPEDVAGTSHISTLDHQQSWKRAKEFTTAGKSGLHFGMFKAQAMDDDLASFDASRRNVPYMTGTFLPRWTTGVDVMLLKASGDRHAHKLRTILLLEADFNMNNKKLSCDGMRLAEEFKLISPEQAGGCKRHRANETSLNFALTCDDS